MNICPMKDTDCNAFYKDPRFYQAPGEPQVMFFVVGGKQAPLAKEKFAIDYTNLIDQSSGADASDTLGYPGRYSTFSCYGSPLPCSLPLNK